MNETLIHNLIFAFGAGAILIGITATLALVGAAGPAAKMEAARANAAERARTKAALDATRPAAPRAPRVTPAPRPAASTTASVPSPGPTGALAVVSALREPASARTAVVLAEVLGPPLSLR